MALGLGVSEASFSAEALQANREGCLTDAQRRDVQLEVDQRRHGGGFFVVTFAAAPWRPMAEDLRSGHVVSIEGAITKDHRGKGDEPRGPGADAQPGWQLGDDLGRVRSIQVNNRALGEQAVMCHEPLFHSAPQAGMVRVFYLPRSRWAVNFEQLPDPPIGDEELSREGVRNALRELKSGWRGRDAVGTAESRARLAAIRRKATSYVSGPAPRADGQTPSAPSAAALLGSWKNPFVRVIFGANGVFEVRMPDGAVQSGHWSIGADGRLRGDMAGAPLEAGVSISGDQLTLAINDQALTLRRSEGV